MDRVHRRRDGRRQVVRDALAPLGGSLPARRLPGRRPRQAQGRAPRAPRLPPLRPADGGDAAPPRVDADGRRALRALGHAGRQRARRRLAPRPRVLQGVLRPLEGAPHYRLAILHITAPEETVQRRVAERAANSKDGRAVPPELVKATRPGARVGAHPGAVRRFRRHAVERRRPAPPRLAPTRAELPSGGRTARAASRAWARRRRPTPRWAPRARSSRRRAASASSCAARLRCTAPSTRRRARTASSRDT